MSDDLWATLRDMVRSVDEINADYYRHLDGLRQAPDEEIVRAALGHARVKTMRLSLDSYAAVEVDDAEVVVAALTYCGRLLPKWERDLLAGEAGAAP